MLNDRDDHSFDAIRQHIDRRAVSGMPEMLPPIALGRLIRAACRVGDYLLDIALGDAAFDHFLFSVYGVSHAQDHGIAPCWPWLLLCDHALTRAACVTTAARESPSSPRCGHSSTWCSPPE
jgi:hypothetical protein